MTNLKLPNLSYESLKNRKAGTIAYATTTAHEQGAATDHQLHVHIMHHGNRIATLTPTSVTVDNCGYDTRTTSHRIHEILRDNRVRVTCSIKNHLMTLTLDADGTASTDFPTTFTTR